MIQFNSNFDFDSSCLEVFDILRKDYFESVWNLLLIEEYTQHNYYPALPLFLNASEDIMENIIEFGKHSPEGKLNQIRKTLYQISFLTLSAYTDKLHKDLLKKYEISESISKNTSPDKKLMDFMMDCEDLFGKFNGIQDKIDRLIDSVNEIEESDITEIKQFAIKYQDLICMNIQMEK